MNSLVLINTPPVFLFFVMALIPSLALPAIKEWSRLLFSRLVEEIEHSSVDTWKRPIQSVRNWPLWKGKLKDDRGMDL